MKKRIEAIKQEIKEVNTSKESALKFLQKIGIADMEGKLHKNFRQ